MNNPTIFLDTPIFFTCAEDTRSRTTLQHARNAGYIIQTSISVPGEAFIQMHEHEEFKNEMSMKVRDISYEWDTTRSSVGEVSDGNDAS